MHLPPIPFLQGVGVDAVIFHAIDKTSGASGHGGSSYRERNIAIFTFPEHRLEIKAAVFKLNGEAFSTISPGNNLLQKPGHLRFDITHKGQTLLSWRINLLPAARQSPVVKS